MSFTLGDNSLELSIKDKGKKREKTEKNNNKIDKWAKKEYKKLAKDCNKDQKLIYKLFKKSTLLDIDEVEYFNEINRADIGFGSLYNVFNQKGKSIIYQIEPIMFENNIYSILDIYLYDNYVIVFNDDDWHSGDNQEVGFRPTDLKNCEIYDVEFFKQGKYKTYINELHLKNQIKYIHNLGFDAKLFSDEQIKKFIDGLENLET